MKDLYLNGLQTPTPDVSNCQLQTQLSSLSVNYRNKKKETNKEMMSF